MVCVLLHPFSHRVSLATIGVCVFCAVTSVAALFILLTERKKMMKKILALLLALFMCLALCACGNGSQATTHTEKVTTEQTTEHEEIIPSKEELLQSAEEVTLEQIQDAELDKVVKAKQLYCGKTLLLSGIIHDIEEGRARLCVESAFDTGGILVYLSNEEILLLHEGQKIVVVGQTSEDTETYIFGNNNESQLITMSNAYMVQDTFRISGEAWSANEDFAPAFDFSVEDLWYSPLLYFAESVDTSVFPDKERTITVEGKFIYDGATLSEIVDAIIVE